MIIEGKLKPFLEITKAIAPPPLNEQVILPHVFLFLVLKTRGLLGWYICQITYEPAVCASPSCGM